MDANALAEYSQEKSTWKKYRHLWKMTASC